MRTLVLALGLLAAAAPAGAGEAAGPARPAKVAEPNPRIVEAPANRWLKLHAQKPGDAVRFALQEHGGSCFDRKGVFVTCHKKIIGRETGV